MTQNNKYWVLLLSNFFNILIKVKTKNILIIFSVLIGFQYFFVSRHSMSSDGMSYLDMARGFSEGNFNYLINPLWSPLYPMFLGALLYIIHPNSYWEFTLCNFATYLTYLFALLTFTFFLNQFLKYYHSKINNEMLKISDSMFYAIGYIIFLQVSINIVTLWGLGPDILLSAFIYLAFGLLIKIYFKNDLSLFIAFGIVLALGYLTKAVLFILAFVFIFFAISFNFKKNLLKGLFALVIFLVVSFPYIQSLSGSLGRLSFGESGKINYVWYIDNIPIFTHWQGNDKYPEHGNPIHPTRIIFSNPNIYEFASPIPGTYAPWFNPIYWYEGAKLTVLPMRQIASMVKSLDVFVQIFIHKQIALIVGFMLLFYVSNRVKTVFDGLKDTQMFLLPSFFAFFLLSNVHLEERYIGAFVVVLWLGLLMTIRMNNSEQDKKLLKNILLAVFITLFFNFSCRTVRDIFNWSKNMPVHIEWVIAENLRVSGIKEGDKVATIGYQIPESAYWASILKTKIVSEIIEEDMKAFWALTPEDRQKAVNAFKSTGAKVLVSKEAPRNCIKEGWRYIPNTKSYFLLI